MKSFSSALLTESSLPKEVEFLQPITVDINGLGRGKIFPVEKKEDLFKNRVEIVCLAEVLGTLSEIPFSLTELSDAHYENSVIVPDTSTLKLAPWVKDSSVAMMFYDSYDKNTFQPFPFSPRLTAKNKIKELEDMGLKLFVGVENEYRLFDKVTMKPHPESINFFEQFTQSKCMLPYITELKKELRKIDIDMDSCQLEFGSGQIEIPLKRYCGIDACDKVWLFKQIAKHVAYDMGFIASFMSVPIPNETANGMHINHSLWQTSETNGLVNAMWNPSAQNELSDIGKHWLAGQLKHAKALMAFFSPTINCYRRIRAAAWAPNTISWNYTDRSVSMRVKMNKNLESDNYIENRLASSSCNIYLAVAAMIAAGIDGIKNKLTLIEPGNGPHCEKLPTSLSESLDALKKNEVLKESLGEKFIDWFIKVKQETEVDILKYVDIGDRTDQGIAREIKKYLHL